MSLFWGIKQTQKGVPSFDSNSSSKLTSRVTRYTQKTKFVVLLRANLILLVGTLGYVTQVIDLVVGFVSVLVINVVGRPHPMHVEPRQAMRQVILSVNADSDVSVMERSARVGSRGLMTFEETSGLPSEDPGSWIIVE